VHVNIIETCFKLIFNSLVETHNQASWLCVITSRDEPLRLAITAAAAASVRHTTPPMTARNEDASPLVSFLASLPPPTSGR
jgi:hypothetical protein